jgi:hypothetical protein
MSPRTAAPAPAPLPTPTSMTSQPGQRSIMSPSVDVRESTPPTMSTSTSPAPPDTETPQAVAAVIHTPELLEMILLNLHPEHEMKTLLLSQRFCKAFANAIAGSKKLQRKLWLLPDPSVKQLRYNRLLLEKFRKFGIDDIFPESSGCPQSEPAVRTHCDSLSVALAIDARTPASGPGSGS